MKCPHCRKEVFGSGFDVSDFYPDNEPSEQASPSSVVKLKFKYAGHSKPIPHDEEPDCEMETIESHSTEEHSV